MKDDRSGSENTVTTMTNLLKKGRTCSRCAFLGQGVHEDCVRDDDNNGEGFNRILSFGHEYFEQGSKKDRNRREEKAKMGEETGERK